MIKTQCMIERKVVRQVKSIGIDEAVNLIMRANDGHAQTVNAITVTVFADFMVRIPVKIKMKPPVLNYSVDWWNNYFRWRNFVGKVV